MKHIKFLLAALICCSATAHAQNCLGQRALSNAPANVSVNYRFLKEASGPEGRVLFGSPRLIGGLNIGFLNVSGSRRAFDLGGQVGSTLHVGNTLVACPIVSFNHQSSVFQDSNFPGLNELLLGGSIGMQRSVSPTVTLIPYAGAGFLRASLKSFYSPALDSTRAKLTHTGAELFGGVGVQFSKKFLARASIRYRDDFGDVATMFTLGLTVAPNRKIRSN